MGSEKPRQQFTLTAPAATWLLAGAALASALVYRLIFAAPFNLFALYQYPLLNLAVVSQSWPAARWWLLVGFGLQAGLYWLGWQAVQRTGSRTAWLIVLGGAALFVLLLLGMYPVGAADLFDNIMHGRVLGVYGANPFHTPPATFVGDPFLSYVAWPQTPSAYGPLWEALAGGLAWQAGDDLLTNILAFKLLNGLFLAGAVGIVAAILQRFAPERALAGVLLLAWNPVILYEAMGNGHNDIAMIFWVLLAVWLLLTKRHTLAILALVVGGLFKFIPILLLPTAGLLALRAQPDWRSRLRFSIVTPLATSVLLVFAYLPFWFGPTTLAMARRQQLFTTSLPATLYGLLAPIWGEQIWTPIRWTAVLLVILFVVGQSIFAESDQTWLCFSRAALHSLLFYLLVSCLWVQPWYAVWPLALAVLLPVEAAKKLSFLFGFIILTKPLLFEPLWLWRDPLPPVAWREVRLGPAVLLAPWTYALWAVWHAARKRKNKGHGL